jgi:hypothetical protein
MTLHVPFEQFPKTVESMLQTKNVFVAPQGRGALVTAADSLKGFMIVCHADLPVAQVKTKLTRSGLEVFEGAWKLSDEVDPDAEGRGDFYIAAVAYKSADTMPGVWVDAHRTLPTQVQVLRAMYEEFRATGELPEVSFEEFVRLSEPNVVVVAPNEIQSFLDKKPES